MRRAAAAGLSGVHGAVAVCVVGLLVTHAKPSGAEEKRTRRPPTAGMPGPFDPADFTEGYHASVGTLWARAEPDLQTQRGYDIAVGRESFTRRPSPLLLYGRGELALRILPDDGWSLSLSRHIVVGGLVLGPVELFGGVGFSTITVDRLRGTWGYGLLSPLATAGASVTFGRIRIEARAQEEYLWRWDADDYWLRGLFVGIGLSDH
jgi:hypothetical protein